MRGVAINVNYRYLDEELWYLLDNSDAEALVFHASLADRVGRVADRLPKLKLLVEVDDTGAGDQLGGRAVDYEELVAAHAPATRITRDENDLYMLYTGGTTGMPKGVMYPIGEITPVLHAARVPRRRPARPRPGRRDRARRRRARSRRPHVGERHRRTADARHRAVARRAACTTSAAVTS